MYRLLALAVIIAGIVALAIGGVFIYQGISKNAWLTENVREEKITLGLSGDEVAAGRVLSNAADLQRAGDTVREHRHGIAPTYQDALNGGQFDPENPRHLTYSQAMNLENYLYLGVLSFGVTQMALGAGVFMIVVAIALSVTGVILFHLAKEKSPAH